ncbi:CRISPR-associated helicase Cas3' [Candidatus Pacearchaeota archaeon]|nr:MAG: CRISPR-associated helicase Cas3' [Candidatus Pacearchaeota archaeon]
MKQVEQFYKQYFNIDLPYEYQIKVWQQVNNLNFPLLLKSPTGSGKTEAVLAPFLSQFVDNDFYIAPRMIYVLPMRVLVNNVAERIKKYVKKISPYISVEIQHGDLPDAPFFISDIVVTTLDQFFYGFARSSKQVGHHLDIPAGAIASSIVIFDEAHMYRDSFTFSIMRALMEILYKSHVPFILMTATMPESLEKSLFENIPLFDNQKIIGNIELNSTLKITIEKDPLYSNNEVNISNSLLNKIKNHRTLIVVNQVKRAQKIYKELKKQLELSDDQIVLLHSRFTRIDKESHEKKALSLIPHKERGKIIIPKNVGIVVSTQVLEAGIDFSAELLLTELAPADSLVQRAGRCARYEGEKGEMIIFPVEENKGHLPYKKELLSKTLEWLKNNQNFNIKNFDEVCSFVNDTLDYKANDYEARDTLIDLYECVLYADTEPKNIQVRKSKPVTLIVVDFSIGEGKKEKDIIRNSIRKTNLRENFIDTDIGIAWQLFKNKILKYRFKYDIESKNWDYEEIRDIQPFDMYILEKNNYDKNIGVKNDSSYFI